MYNHCLLLLIVLTLFLSCSKEETNTTPDEECYLSEIELQVIEELENKYAYPFNNADPSDPDTSLSQLIEYLGDARIVGMGEATHGSAEFFDMKHKVFRSLVEDKDFKAIIFEIPWGNCLAVNDYVRNGVGSADEAINNTWYWVYDTGETRALAEWMYDYNKIREEEEKLFFVGCDPQGPDFEIEKSMIRNYLMEVSPDLADSAYVRYYSLPKDLSEYGGESAEVKKINQENTAWVYNAIEDRRESFVSQTGNQKYEIILMAAHVIQHREMMYRIQSFGQTRDSLMAIYALWWQQIIGNDEKVAVWAHNYHVMDNPTSGALWMGSYLRNAIGQDYQNICFSFTTGQLNAFLANRQGDFLNAVQAQEVPLQECRTLNYLFQQVSADNFYLIFDELQWPDEAAIYLGDNQNFYQMGAGFNRLYMHNYTGRLPLSRYWDVLIHFDQVKASDLR